MLPKMCLISPGEQQGTSSISPHCAALGTAVVSCLPEKPCPRRCPCAEPLWDTNRHCVPQHGLVRGRGGSSKLSHHPSAPEDAALCSPSPPAHGTHQLGGSAPVAGAPVELCCWGQGCSSTPGPAHPSAAGAAFNPQEQPLRNSAQRR